MKRSGRIGRRTLLRGAGAALALPILDQMTPVAAAGVRPTPPPVRLAWLFAPNGVNVEQWRPTGEGQAWRLSPTLQPLADLKQELLVVSGLAQLNARALGDGGGGHARSASCFLTGAHPVKTAGTGMRAGVSVDQLAASQIGGQTLLPSLELGIDAGRGAGTCDTGYACAYSNNISWRSPSQPAAKEVNPRMAFERLFGQGGKAAQERVVLRRSILDVVAEQAKALQRQVGRGDRRKLDEYFHSVRDAERRVELLSDQEANARRRQLVGDASPPEEPRDVGEHIRSMGDLIVLAFRADTTRVATLMLANEGSNRKYAMVGVDDAHHQISHHKNKPELLAKIARIDKYLVEQFAYVLRRMRETPELDGTLLDNSLVLYGGAISDGNRHYHSDLPIVVGGRGGGAFAPGRHVQAARDTPLCNLYLSMLHAAGVEAKRFGDSTRRFAQAAG